MKLNADLNQAAVVDAPSLTWTPSPVPGVVRRMLERDGDEVARATSLVRFAPNSAFSAHRHGGGEEFLVLEGVFSDESGDFPAGTYARNPVGSRHVPSSEPGCVILVKLWQMPAVDQLTVKTDTLDSSGWRDTGDGIRSLLLHETEHERVEIVEQTQAGKATDTIYSGSAEIFVLEGELETEQHTLAMHSWLRIPPGARHRLRARPDCRYYLKTGHLRPSPPLPGG